MLIGDGALASESSLRSRLLHGYDKSRHPENDVVLTYEIFYISCPIPDPATGRLLSKISDKQVYDIRVSYWNSLASELTVDSLHFTVGRYCYKIDIKRRNKM